MTLLNETTRRPLDPEYASAADRRRTEGPRRRGALSSSVALMIAIGLGLVTTAATQALRAPEPSALAARTLLEDQINERAADVDRLRRENTGRSTEIAELQERVLAAENSPLLAQLAADSVASGATAVEGPGLRISLKDAAGDGFESDDESRVQDGDLQALVNGLWAAGAEAIAVDGERLTATTAIRSAGSAILVDLVPLIGPYVVEAVGDPQELQTNLARSSAGPYLADLRSAYGIGVEISGQQRLKLPAASGVALRSASVPRGVPLLAGDVQGPLGTGTPTGSASPGAGGVAGSGEPDNG